MAQHNLAERLQRSTITFAALGIVVISIIVATVSIVPLYYHLKEEEENKLALFATSRAAAVEAYLIRLSDITSQITSRTQIRKALEEYNRGEISREELVQFSVPRLTDATEMNEDIVGITRLDQAGHPVITIGTPIPLEQLSGLDDTSAVQVHNLIAIDYQPYLVISAPIRSQTEQVGTDIVLFNSREVQQITEAPPGRHVTGEVLFGILQNQQFQVIFPQPASDTISDTSLAIPRTMQIDTDLQQALNRDGFGVFAPDTAAERDMVVAYSPVQHSPWGMVVTGETREVYALVNRQIVILSSLIGLLLLAGILGMVRLLRPLTGKMVLHADELQQEILEKTASLQAELQERLRVEATLHTVNRALETLSACNQGLLRAVDEHMLLQHVCDVIVDIGGYVFVWVGYIDPAMQRIIPRARAGYEADYLSSIDMTCDDSTCRQEPVSSVMCTGTSVIVDDIAACSAFEPWREEANRRGYGSMIVLPLMHNTTRIGTLTICADHPAAFEPHAARLLTELADDLSFGITTLRMRTERQSALEALQQEKQRSELILYAAGEGIFGLDRQGHTTFVNPAALRMTGYSEDELIGENHHLLVHHSYADHSPHSAEACQVCAALRDGMVHRVDWEVFWRKDGTCFPVEYFSTPMYNDTELVGAVVTFQDISERKAAEEQLRYQALHDTLTGLPNRAYFLEVLRQAIERMHQGETYRYVIFFLDLDNFKLVNDSMGHLEGDKFLITIAQRLMTAIDHHDTVARFGGDEFVLLLDQSRAERNIATVAEQIQQTLAVPLQLNGQEVTSSVSIGIVSGSCHYDNPTDLLRDADTALHHAKARGRNRYEIFDRAMRDRLLDQVHLETALRRAIERHELRAYYQPIVALDSGRIIGFEALIRWQHPDRGILSPDIFIPIAEDVGLMVSIGWWIIHEACRQLCIWHTHFPELRPLTINVNLSGTELMQGSVVERIRQILEATGLEAGSLKVEITESVMMDHAEQTIATLTQLRDLGVQLCIDDFGTGYSSLRYLHRFPLQILKIDRSFIGTLNSDADSTVITHSIVMLSHTLGMEIIAEGIETVRHLNYLRTLQCEYGQGYLFSRPLDGSATTALLVAAAQQTPPFCLLPEQEEQQP